MLTTMISLYNACTIVGSMSSTMTFLAVLSGPRISISDILKVTVMDMAHMLLVSQFSVIIIASFTAVAN